LAPATADLLLGSAPLFFKSTAWPMAASNAVTAAQGLDPRHYDPINGTYMRLAGKDPDTGEDLMNGERYLSNIILSGLVPATEHIAGFIGGSGGVLGKPLQNLLQKRGAPGSIRAGVDILGEGAEEVVANLWENYQMQGLKNWFADNLYQKDEEGNVVVDPITKEPLVKLDTSGHEMYDPNTAPVKRFLNALAEVPENLIAGSYLGGGLGAPKYLGQALTHTGYFDPKNRGYRSVEGDEDRIENIIQLGPEDIGTYGERRQVI